MPRKGKRSHPGAQPAHAGCAMTVCYAKHRFGRGVYQISASLRGTHRMPWQSVPHNGCGFYHAKHRLRRGICQISSFIAREARPTVAIRSTQCQLHTARGAVPARRKTTMHRPAAKNSISRRRQIIPVCLLCHFHKNFPPCAGPPQPPKSNFLKNPTFSPKFPASPRPPAREHNSTAPRPPPLPPMGGQAGISCVKPGVFHSLHRFFHSPPRLWKTPVEILFSLHKTFRQETTESVLFSPSQFSQRPLFPAKKSS